MNVTSPIFFLVLRSPCTYRSMLFPGALQLSWYWFKGHLLTHGYGSNRVAGNLPPGEGHKQISIKPNTFWAKINKLFFFFSAFFFTLFFFYLFSFYFSMVKQCEGFSSGQQGPVFLQFFFSLYKKSLFFLFLFKNKFLFLFLLYHRLLSNSFRTWLLSNVK